MRYCGSWSSVGLPMPSVTQDLGCGGGEVVDADFEVGVFTQTFRCSIGKFGEALEAEFTSMLTKAFGSCVR